MNDGTIRTLMAERLKIARLNAHMTVKEAGKALGLGGTTVSSWEHLHGQPDADTLVALCDLYGITDINYFYGRTPSLDPESAQLLDLYRGADTRAREDAINTLRTHQLRAQEKRRQA